MDTKQKQTEEYSLIVGGLFRNAQAKIGLKNHQGFLALAGVCFAWLPLVILTLWDGTFFSGVSVNFLKDIAFHARLLVALPVLILIRNNINIKTTGVIKYMTDFLLEGEDRRKMIEVTIPRMQKLACSSLTEIILILIVLAGVLGFVKTGTYGGLTGDSTSWRMVGLPENKVISLAGKWALFISLPFFQFLLLQWIWRYIVWMMLLYKFTKSGIKLLPTHADRCGGLGMLIFAQRSFSFVFIAGSLVISGQLLVYILSSPEAIKMIQGVVIGYLILSISILILPLLFFIGKLVRTKQLGLLQFSQLSTEMSGRFEKDWLNDNPFEKRLEEKKVDPSMAYDYSSMFDNLQQLSIVPVKRLDILGFTVSIALPFIPILFIYFSVDEVLSKIVGFLF